LILIASGRPKVFWLVVPWWRASQPPS